MAVEKSKSKTHEDCTRWMQHILEVQNQRTPEAMEAARQRIERARKTEVSYRKCKAVKGHAIRSRAIVSEGLRQMATSAAPSDYMAVQERWHSAQEASKSRQKSALTKADEAEVQTGAVELLRDVSDEEEEAMVEVAGIVGAEDMRSMAAVGAEGIAPPPAAGAAPAPGTNSSSAGTVQSLLAQLRTEPEDAAECGAKFMLYEGYAKEVEDMRNSLLQFHQESRPTVPPAVALDMDKQVKGIDTHEAMGIPDDAREWFVFHMMRQAERNNTKMASVLDGFEKRLEFLASNDQAECPVCLERFEEGGEHVPETLSCCHKVCKDCWEHWSAVMRGQPFCPLCRHEAFLSTVAEHSASPDHLSAPAPAG